MPTQLMSCRVPTVQLLFVLTISVLESQVTSSISTQLHVSVTDSPGTEANPELKGTWPTTSELPRNQTGCAGFVVNARCYTNRSSNLTKDSCNNVNGNFDKFCYYDNPLTCEYYSRNDQCYSTRSTTLTPSSCHNINGYYTEEGSSSSGSIAYCYYSSFNCVQSTSPNGQCFANLSTVFTTRTCKVIGGFYDNVLSVCYFDTFVCPSSGYRLNGQCYTQVSRRVYTRDSCDVIGGYYDTNGDCFYSGYCDAFALNNQCYRFMTSQYNCGSCRLVDGYIDTSGNCFYTRNCSYYSISNNQCYRNRSTVIDAASCSSLDDNAFYASTDASCFYTVTGCADSQYAINCGCFSNRSSSYTADTCAAFSTGSYSNGICYYNSSDCQYFELDGQCYRYLTQSFTPSTCLNVRGQYRQSTGQCYYTTFSCPGYVANDQCYGNRSSLMSRSTCQNIGGFYGYLFCLFDTFNCSGYSIGGQCHQRRSTSYTCDTCANLDGYCESNSSSSTCYYTSTLCVPFAMNGQCYSLMSLTMTCLTCRLIGGYYFSNSAISICYYSSTRDCRYLWQGECYMNRTVIGSSSCNQNNSGHYVDSSYCYFNEDPIASDCLAEYYHQCVCYSNKSQTMTVYSCDNIEGGYWMKTESTCYYNNNSTCSGHWTNSQCYSQASTEFTVGTCKNLDGFFVSSSNDLASSSGVCYYQRYDCTEDQTLNGGWYKGQCYTGCSKAFSCETCTNIGGLITDHYGCCYYSQNCVEPHFSANEECYDTRTLQQPSSGRCQGTVSAGYCYYNVNNCSTPFYLGCHCYHQSSSIYSRQTCINVGGSYNEAESQCYYDAIDIHSECHGFWYGDQCFSVYNAFFNVSTCPGVYDPVDGRCYIY